ncbi:transcriptional regulator XRE family [Clostridium sp. CAG:448]|nr:transcriptional regulator XRE family [Clostridium sp. CAG:448]
MTVGERIKELREKSGFTQNKLAEWAGVSQTHLRRVELGEADITVGHLRLICDALGISLRDFFSEPTDSEDELTVLSHLSARQRKLLIEFLKSL